MNTPATPATTEDLSACVAACLAALEQSQACANACIRSGDRMLENCALLSLDCAAICQATLNVLLRQSDHHGDFCALCQHICNACARECEQHQHAHCPPLRRRLQRLRAGLCRPRR